MSNIEGGPDFGGEQPVRPKQESGAEIDPTPQGDPNAHPDFPPYIHIEDPQPPFGGLGSSLHFKHYSFELPEDGLYKDLPKVPLNFMGIDEAHHILSQQGCPALFPEDTPPEVLDATRNEDGTFNVKQKAVPHSAALDDLMRASRESYKDYLRRMGVLRDQEQPQPPATRIPLKDGFGRDIPPVTILSDLHDADPLTVKDLGMQSYQTPRMSAYEVLHSLLGERGPSGEEDVQQPLGLGALVNYERRQEIEVLYKAVKGEPTDLPEPLTPPLEGFNFNPHGMFETGTDVSALRRDYLNQIPPLSVEDKELPLPLPGTLEPPIQVHIPTDFKPVDVSTLSPDERRDVEASISRIDAMLNAAERANPAVFQPGSIDFDAIASANLTDEGRRVVDPTFESGGVEDGEEKRKRRPPLFQSGKGFGYVEMTDPDLGNAPEAKGQYFEERARGYKVNEPETGGDA